MIVKLGGSMHYSPDLGPGRARTNLGSRVKGGAVPGRLLSDPLSTSAAPRMGKPLGQGVSREFHLRRTT